MGGYMTVYVGPFLACKKRPNSYADGFALSDGRLCDLRGMLQADDGDLRYFGPNVEMPDIERQLRFDKYEDAPVVVNVKQLSELSAFALQFQKDISFLREEYEDVTVKWGIVPGYA